MPLVEEKLALLVAEGLPLYWGHMDCVCAFTRCVSDGDLPRARQWMRKAIKMSTVLQGSDSKLVHNLERLLRQYSI